MASQRTKQRRVRHELEDITITQHDGSTTTCTASEALDECWTWIDAFCFKRGHIDPLRCMSAIKTFILLDTPLPEDLKTWLLDGLEAHTADRGEKKLDEILGYTNKEHQRNAFKRAEAETPLLLLLVEYLLLSIDDLKPTQAARLAVWREQSSMDPENVAKAWRKLVKANAKTGKPRLETNISDEEAFTFLETFINMKTNLNMGGVAKDFKKLSDKFDDLTCRREKPD